MHLIVLFLTLALLVLVNSLSLFMRRRKLPPGPVGLPIFGNLFEIGSKPHVSFLRLAKKYGPLMFLKFGSISSVVVSSPEIAREILQKHDEALCDRFVPDVATGQANFHLSIVWLPMGDRWRMLRKVLNTQLTHTHQLDSFAGLRHKAVRELVEYLKEFSERSDGETPVAIGNLAFGAALNQMSKTCFSQNVAEYESKEIQGFMKAVKTVMHVSGQFNIADVFPFLKTMDLQGLRRKSKEAYGWLEAVIEVIVDQRMASSSMHNNGDLLDSFIDYSLQHSDFNIQQFKVLLLELILAGSDTSSITIEWAMTELLLNPDVMTKLGQEIKELVGATGKIDEADILKLPYLQAVIKETMRLRLSVPLLIPHKSTKEVEVNGYVIPRNTQIMINAWAMARDPCYWESPNEFLPERFLNSNVDFKGQHFEFIPFSSGRRICPGINLAQRVVSLVIASMVYHFDWKLPRGTTIDNLDMDDVFGLTLRRATPLLAVPTVLKH